MSTDIDDIGLSAEEQAQFDAMREAGSNASSPAETVQPEAAAPDAGVTPAADASQPEPEDHDDDVETVKGPDGREVLDRAGKPHKRVNYNKYARLQAKYRELEGKFGQTQEERARIDERLKIINEALATPAPTAVQDPVDEDPEPDPDQNIFEHNRWLVRQRQRDREEFENFRNQQMAERRDQQIAETYKEHAVAYARQNKDFGAAYNFLLNTRKAELEAAGWTDQKKIMQQIVSEEKGLVAKALEDNINPAERIFRMSQARGFRPAPPAPAGGAPAAAAVPGTPLTAPAPAAQRPPSGIPSAAEQVAMAARGVEAATSLSNAGGAPIPQLTAASLLTMDEDTFARAVASMSKAQLREVFGD